MVFNHSTTWPVLDKKRDVEISIFGVLEAEQGTDPQET